MMRSVKFLILDTRNNYQKQNNNYRLSFIFQYIRYSRSTLCRGFVGTIVEI